VDFKKPFDEEAFMDVERSIFPASGHATPTGTEPHGVRCRLETLSRREREIVGRLVAGKSCRAIACELNLSPRTVEIYQANVMAILEADDLSDLVSRIASVTRRNEHFSD
jgi:two-component system response regulator FixJ